MRAWLADDVPAQERSAQPSPGGWQVALDGDPGTALEWTQADGVSSLPSDEWVSTQIVVRTRQFADYDGAGNPMYRWVDAYAVKAWMPLGARDEVDDVAGSVKRSTTVRFGYAMDAPVIAETAAVRDEDGTVWRVTRAVRTGAQYVLTIETP